MGLQWAEGKRSFARYCHYLLPIFEMNVQINAPEYTSCWQLTKIQKVQKYAL